MIKQRSKPSLADKIAGVLSAVPSQCDPDDDNVDETAAKLDDFEDIEVNQVDGAVLSTFRRQNVALLSDVDRRYSGKKGSRKDLEEDDELSVEERQESSSEAVSESERAESESEEVESELEASVNGSINLSDAEDEGFQHVSSSKGDASAQVQKGLSVRNQMSIWDSLLEMRIQMQKCLAAANKLPQKEQYKVILPRDDLDCREKVTETRNNLCKALDRMLYLQEVVIKKFPETRNLQKIPTKVSEDEEIPSDTDEEEILSYDEDQPQGKRRKLNDYEQDIADIFSKYKPYRNSTIEKWNTKTRLSVTKNSGPGHSVVSQIEHILGDKEKLHRKTQLKRSNYQILGKEDLSDSLIVQSNEDIGDVKQPEEYNVEIFDDNDFYHQLLRELIEFKSSGVSDPVQLSRQWIQLQNMRSKMKRKIDTRATKGRKIRYAVHTKLVNFMAPMDRQLWTEEAKNELYCSLFGKIEPKRVL